MSAIFAYNNRFHATAAKPATFSSADFASTPPITNLGLMQLPLFGQFTGGSATLTCEATDGTGNSPNLQSFDADVFAVLGCQGFDSGAQVEFLNGMSSIGSATIEAAPLGGTCAIVAVDTPVSLDTLTVEFTSAGSGTHKVGAIWASPSVRFTPLPDVSVTGADTSVVTRSRGNTPWAFGGQSFGRFPIRARTKSYLPWLTALQSAQASNPVLYQLMQRGTSTPLLKAYGLLEQNWQLTHVENGVFDMNAELLEAL